MPSRPTRILVVDDEPDIVASLRDVLERAVPAEVEVAATAAEALQLMRRVPVDLVVADYRMPGMDGLHFLRRAQELRPGVARILMTAYPELPVVVDAINRAKASRVLLKPLDSGKLVETVRQVLEERSPAA